MCASAVQRPLAYPYKNELNRSLSNNLKVSYKSITYTVIGFLGILTLIVGIALAVFGIISVLVGSSLVTLGASLFISGVICRVIAHHLKLKNERRLILLKGCSDFEHEIWEFLSELDKTRDEMGTLDDRSEYFLTKGIAKFQESLLEIGKSLETIQKTMNLCLEKGTVPEAQMRVEFGLKISENRTRYFLIRDYLDLIRQFIDVSQETQSACVTAGLSNEDLHCLKVCFQGIITNVIDFSIRSLNSNLDPAGHRNNMQLCLNQLGLLLKPLEFFKDLKKNGVQDLLQRLIDSKDDLNKRIGFFQTGLLIKNSEILSDTIAKTEEELQFLIETTQQDLNDPIFLSELNDSSSDDESERIRQSIPVGRIEEDVQVLLETTERDLKDRGFLGELNVTGFEEASQRFQKTVDTLRIRQCVLADFKEILIEEEISAREKSTVAELDRDVRILVSCLNEEEFKEKLMGLVANNEEVLKNKLCDFDETLLRIVDFVVNLLQAEKEESQHKKDSLIEKANREIDAVKLPFIHRFYKSSLSLNDSFEDPRQKMSDLVWLLDSQHKDILHSSNSRDALKALLERIESLRPGPFWKDYVLDYLHQLEVKHNEISDKHKDIVLRRSRMEKMAFIRKEESFFWDVSVSFEKVKPFLMKKLEIEETTEKGQNVMQSLHDLRGDFRKHKPNSTEMTWFSSTASGDIPLVISWFKMADRYIDKFISRDKQISSELNCYKNLVVTQLILKDRLSADMRNESFFGEIQQSPESIVELLGKGSELQNLGRDLGITTLVSKLETLLGELQEVFNFYQKRIN